MHRTSVLPLWRDPQVILRLFVTETTTNQIFSLIVLIHEFNFMSDFTYTVLSDRFISVIGDVFMDIKPQNIIV